jgi:hypothetical protein
VRKVMFALAVGTFAALVSSGSADAARIRCGSTWEICAQRGRGPGLVQPSNNVRRGLLPPGASEKPIKQQQR